MYIILYCGVLLVVVEYTLDKMEHFHNVDYHRGLIQLYYEIGKTRCEIDQKIATLRPLVDRTEYNGARMTVEFLLDGIEKDLLKFDKDLPSTLNYFECTANTLLDLKLRVYKCEAKLFEAMRKNRTRCNCK